MENEWLANQVVYQASGRDYHRDSVVAASISIVSTHEHENGSAGEYKMQQFILKISVSYMIAEGALSMNRISVEWNGRNTVTLSIIYYLG